jgi:hypothetical protein
MVQLGRGWPRKQPPLASEGTKWYDCEEGYSSDPGGERKLADRLRRARSSSGWKKPSTSASSPMSSPVVSPLPPVASPMISPNVSLVELQPKVIPLQSRPGPSGVKRPLPPSSESDSRPLSKRVRRPVRRVTQPLGGSCGRKSSSRRVMSSSGSDDEEVIPVPSKADPGTFDALASPDEHPIPIPVDVRVHLTELTADQLGPQASSSLLVGVVESFESAPSVSVPILCVRFNFFDGELFF